MALSGPHSCCFADQSWAASSCCKCLHQTLVTAHDVSNQIILRSGCTWIRNILEGGYSVLSGLQTICTAHWAPSKAQNKQQGTLSISPSNFSTKMTAHTPNSKAPRTVEMTASWLGDDWSYLEMSPSLTQQNLLPGEGFLRRGLGLFLQDQ